MEQDRGGTGRGVEMREIQHQDQRGRKSQQGNQLQFQQNPPPPPPPPQQQQPPPPPAQPQKCPRCDSLNTKFCYYNNYSLAQPRYFCKTCRRYWTQGGTLRNVPVGGGCRKGKRLKRSSSPSSPSMDNFNTSTTSTGSVLPLRSSTKGIDNIPSTPMVPIPAGTGVPPPSMYYPSGGFLSSLAGFQSFTQPLNIGAEFGGSNLALLQGFNLPFHTQQMHQHQHQHHQQQQQQHQQQQQMYLQESHNLNMGISDELEEKVGQQNRPSTSHQEWSHSQSFPSPNPPEAVDYWSNNSTSTTNTATTSNLGVTLNPTHWTDHLSGYGGPPQPQPPPPPPSTTSSSSPSFL